MFKFCRRTLVAFASASAIVALAGCSGGDQDATEPTTRQDTEPVAVELDLDTLEAELPIATLQAEPWANTWVGAVTDELFIGIRVADSDGDSGEPRPVAVYLCDGELSVLLEGEMDGNLAMLEDEDAQVTLELLSDETTGTVTLGGEGAVQFQAERATGDAGVYVAEHEVDDVEVTARWVALADGRQRGVAICCEWPPTGGGPPICRHCRQLN